jgi:hypothetical protein
MTIESTIWNLLEKEIFLSFSGGNNKSVYLPRFPSAGLHQESSPCSGLAVPDAHQAQPVHQTTFFSTAGVLDPE